MVILKICQIIYLKKMSKKMKNGGGEKKGKGEGEKRANMGAF